MNTPEIEKNMKRFNIISEKYSNGKIVNGIDMSDILNSGKTYIAIPIIIFFLLIIFRPSLLYTSQLTEKQSTFSFKKLFIYWFIFSIILDGCLFFYNTSVVK